MTDPVQLSEVPKQLYHNLPQSGTQTLLQEPNISSWAQAQLGTEPGAAATDNSSIFANLIQESNFFFSIGLELTGFWSLIAV